MLRAQLTNALHVAVRRHQHAVRAGDRFEDERGNRVRPLELNDLLDHRQRLPGAVPAALDPVVRVEHVDHARHARLGRPAPGIAGEHHAAGGGAVIRAIAGQDLVPSGGEPRQLDRVLVGFGAAVGEKEDVDVAGRDLRQLGAEPRARLRGHERVRVRQHLELVLYRANHPLVAMTDVHAHQLAVEIDVALAFRGPEVDALRARHRDRIDLRLRRPFEQRVLLRQRNHLFAGHRLNDLSCHVTLLSNHKDHEDHKKDIATPGSVKLFFVSFVSVVVPAARRLF